MVGYPYSNSLLKYLDVCMGKSLAGEAVSDLAEVFEEALVKRAELCRPLDAPRQTKQPLVWEGGGWGGFWGLVYIRV